MGLFRPARTVSGAGGDYWELYVSKTALPPWREGRAGEYDGGLDSRSDLLELPFMILSALWSLLIVPLLRFSVLLPIAVIRGRRSRAVRIEAVRTFPEREVFLWTTTDEQLDAVLDEIAAGLAVGKLVQPEGAVYSGREDG
jgi:hypothetical protein